MVLVKELIEGPELGLLYVRWLVLNQTGTANLLVSVAEFLKLSMEVMPILPVFFEGVPLGVFFVEFCREATLELTAEDLLELN